MITTEEFYQTRNTVSSDQESVSLYKAYVESLEVQLQSKEEELKDSKNWLSKAVKTFSESIEVQNMAIKAFEQERKKNHSIIIIIFSAWRELRNGLKERAKLYPDREAKIPADLVLREYEHMYKKAYAILKDNQ